MTSSTRAASTSPAASFASLFNAKPLDSAHMTDAKRYAHNEEPPLGDLLADPIMLTLMHSDGVAEDSLSQLIHCARHRLQAA